MKKHILALACIGLVRSFAACGSGVDVAAVTPDRAPARGGDLVTIHGSGFEGTPTVRFAGAEAVVKSVTESAIEVVAPRGVAGVVAVEVTSGGVTARRDAGFTYQPLSMTFVDSGAKCIQPFAVDGGAAATADFDGDGDLDVFQTGGTEGVLLYTNDGKGCFFDVTSIDAGGSDVRSIVARDFDGDGAVDLFLGTTAMTPTVYLAGRAGGKWIASKSALPMLLGSDQMAITYDYDGDGDLDLVTTGSAKTKDGTARVVVLSNQGEGTFADATKSAIAESFVSTGVAAGDVDGDGDLDLFFAADAEASRLYINDGHGFFFHAAPDALPTTKLAAGIPVFGDLDGDGRVDLYVPSRAQDRVLVNDGKGRFTDLTAVRVSAESAPGASAAIVDLDMDGAADVVVVERTGGLRLQRNDGTGRFFDYSSQLVGNAASLLQAGVVIADFDRDGDDDIFVSRAGYSRPALFVNRSFLPSDDADHDGVPDDVDSCPAVSNPSQGNADSVPFRCASGAACTAAYGCSMRTFGRSAYLVCTKSPGTWADAEATCVARGSHLVAITTAAESAFVSSLGPSVWIGATDAAKEGTWTWTTGEAGNGFAPPWGPLQPDNSQSSEDCAMIGVDGKWNDLSCAAILGYVCEDTRARVPDPGDACDLCPAKYDPESQPITPVSSDADGGGDAGAGDGGKDGGPNSACK
ncbi:hypothetical protein BH09MYX1_BH09MYX1_36540 [soil metagenome]